MYTAGYPSKTMSNNQTIHHKSSVYSSLLLPSLFLFSSLSLSRSPAHSVTHCYIQLKPIALDFFPSAMLTWHLLPCSDTPFTHIDVSFTSFKIKNEIIISRNKTFCFFLLYQLWLFLLDSNLIVKFVLLAMFGLADPRFVLPIFD